MTFDTHCKKFQARPTTGDSDEVPLLNIERTEQSVRSSEGQRPQTTDDGPRSVSVLTLSPADALGRSGQSDQQGVVDVLVVRVLALQPHLKHTQHRPIIGTVGGGDERRVRWTTSTTGVSTSTCR